MNKTRPVFKTLSVFAPTSKLRSYTRAVLRYELKAGEEKVKSMKEKENKYQAKK